MTEEKFIANQGDKWHIFDKQSKKSLCGRWSMPFLPETEMEFLTGTEKFKKGDCKKCFEKAGHY